MERVGGYASYLALLDDASAYNDVMIALEGETEAKRIQKIRNPPPKVR